jgi:hypothetical protein
VCLATLPTAAQADDDGSWTPTNWTGFVAGAPVPGVGLSAAMPAPLVPVPYLPITYQGQSTCDPTPKPGAIAMADVIKATYGASEIIGIPRGCDVGGRSEHKEGRAVDWMVDVRDPAERAMAEAYLNWLLGPDQAGRMHGHAYQLGVMYIGWHDRMWRGYRPEIGWTELKGCFSKPEKRHDNYCHRNHIHISLTLAGAAGNTTPAVTPIPVAPVPPPEPERPPAPVQPGPDDDAFMSIGSQIGFLAGEDLPLAAGELRTVDLAPVPLNASSALVLVSTRQASRKGTLRIGMVDAKSAVNVKVPRKRARTSVIQVPVAGGAVQIAGPKRGAVAVRVDVLGYTIAGREHIAVGTPPETIHSAAFEAGVPQVVTVRGVGPVPQRPSRATAVILRLTTKSRGAAGRVAAYPVGGADLGTESAVVQEKGTRSSIVSADIGTDGAIAIASSVPAKVTVEIVGYVRK